MRKLIVYPNYSMGGVTSVIRGRAAAEPQTKFDVIFLRDRGGEGAFADFLNIEVRVCSENRVEGFLSNRLSSTSYDEISVLSQPKIANFIAKRVDAAVTYEFHSSDMNVIQSELDELNLAELARIAAPSATMVEQIRGILPGRYKPRMVEIPNLVDTTAFSLAGSADFLDCRHLLAEECIPLIWVGRFDKGKGYQYFLRLLAKLPEHFVAFVVVSLEDTPDRPARFLAEANAMGVSHRVKIFANLGRLDISNLYRSARERGGWLVSTSLMESFGYSVAEALVCGLRVAAFELPAFHEFNDRSLLKMVDIGSVSALTKQIQQESPEALQEE